MKKFLIFLGHPAHFHLYKNIIKRLEENGHKLLVLIKEKDILEELIKNEGFEYQNIQRVANKKRQKNRFSILAHSFYDLLIRDFRLYPIVKNFKPDLMIGSEPSIAHIGFVTGIPSIIAIEDDLAVHPEFCHPTLPFATHILTPHLCEYGRYNKKKIGYAGYHKLAYLHPNYFKPDINKVSELIENDRPYYILRLSALTASHDVNIQGLNDNLVDNLLEILQPKGKVYISSERQLAPRFEQFRFRINPSLMHHALSFANLLVGDSQSMTVEAAILGTPSVRYSDFAGEISVLEELEHQYDLTYGVKTNNPDKLMKKVKELLEVSNIKPKWRERADKMLSEKIDVTSFFVWFVENYPESAQQVKSDPSYSTNFM